MSANLKTHYRQEKYSPRPLSHNQWTNFMFKMKVTVRFRGPLANQMDSDSGQIEIVEGASLRDLLTLLITGNDTVRETWNSPEHIDRDTLILRNEVDIGLSGGLETKLTDGDVFVILPLVHGG